MEVPQDVIQEASTTSEDESGPFLRIENVVSLNPEAITEDVSFNKLDFTLLFLFFPPVFYEH